MKRILDIIVAAVALVIFSPVLVVTAIAIAATSPGGALFCQTRIGKGCKPFTIYKFRSMRKDAPSVGPHFTSADDPRITKIGRIIRKTSIDELPQLLNVLAGQMSIVGPRPDTPKQESDYAPDDWKERHRVRPGITGLAQCKLRSAATPEQRTAMDLEYVRTSSLLLDLQIVVWTAQLVLGRRGAN